MERGPLRPLERAVLRLADKGLSQTEIAWRFRRSPGHVDRVLQLSELPRRGAASTTSGALRPIERCVLRAQANGVDAKEIAARFRRTPAHIERIAAYAAYKQGKTPDGDLATP